VSTTIWHILFYAWAASEIYIAIATRTRHGGGQRLDRGSMATLWITILGSITAAEFIGAMRPHTMFADARWPKLAAIVVLLLGMTIRWVAILSLGKAFSANVAIRDTQTVHKSGLYRLVRHPSYSGLILIFTAIALHEQSWLAAACVIVPPTAALLYRIHVEEIALVAAFGDQYTEYCRATKRLVPAIF
jgi:protein-S-isoprenylcysteine O-methyltransferase Ste14